MQYLESVLKISDIGYIPNEMNDGVLIVSDNQNVIDYCKDKNIPVAAFEHDEIKGLKCDYVLMDIDEIDDLEYEKIYRREKRIPWDIAFTERTIIREYGSKDLDDLVELYNKPGITDYMEPLYEYEVERDYEEKYIQYIYKLYGFGMWLVYDKITNVLIGRAGIEVRESCKAENQAELGFCIASDRWHEGLAYEVCSKIVQLAFEEYGMTSLVARSDPRNVASHGLLKKLGFSYVSTQDDGDLFFVLEKGKNNGL